MADAPAAMPAVASRRAATPRTRTQLLLDGAIVPTLLRLAPANVAINVLSIAVNTSVDAYFVGRLAPSALGGLALAFPLVMLMQQMANAGMGGAVAAAMATLFTVGFHLAGTAIYEAMGGTGVSLEAALAYSNVVFSGAAAYWLLSALTSIVLASALISGWGPFPVWGWPGQRRQR